MTRLRALGHSHPFTRLGGTSGNDCACPDPDSAHGHLVFAREGSTTPSPDQFKELALTHREREVLAWVAAGKTNEEIAAILGASARTIEKHLEHIFMKLGVETRTAAVMRALEIPHGRDPAADHYDRR